MCPTAMATGAGQNMVGLYGLDSEFEKLLRFVSETGEHDLFEAMKRMFHTWLEHTDPQERNAYYNWMGKFSFWGSINHENGDYTLLKNRAETLKTHVDDFLWLYRRLADYRSKLVLWALLAYWTENDSKFLKRAKDEQFETYFDLDLIRCGEQEIFVDLGGFVGDTVLAYIKTYGSACYKKIYTYEISERNLVRMRTKLTGYDRIEICARGVGEKAGLMYIDKSMNAVDAVRLGNNGTEEIQVVALDEDIKEAISYLKMDIEGGEYAALKGAAEHIRADKPKLVVSLYHSNDDLWRLPKLIQAIMPDYRFYLRYYGSTFIATDYILYCLPPER